MNYQKHYELLISKYGREDLPDDNYFYERHHVVPKSLGGSDSPENLVHLTPREHYIAHYLLSKFLSESAEMRFAFSLMSANNTVKSREFEKIRERVEFPRRRIHTPKGWFVSVTAAANAHKTTTGVISSKANSDRIFNKEYYYEYSDKDGIFFTQRQTGKHRSKRVYTPAGIFPSVRSAGAYYQVYHSTISKWCKTRPKEFYLEDSSICINSKPRRVHTPAGWFCSVSQAGRAMGLSGAGIISARCRAGWPGYYYSEQV
jgi:hypothetical protein